MSLLSKSEVEKSVILSQAVLDLLGLCEAAKFDEMEEEIDLRVTFARLGEEDQGKP